MGIDPLHRPPARPPARMAPCGPSWACTGTLTHQTSSRLLWATGTTRTPVFVERVEEAVAKVIVVHRVKSTRRTWWRCYSRSRTRNDSKVPRTPSQKYRWVTSICHDRIALCAGTIGPLCYCTHATLGCWIPVPCLCPKHRRWRVQRAARPPSTAPRGVRTAVCWQPVPRQTH